MTPNESPAELLPDDVLPCDVQVAPRTIIRRGCKVSTLLHCLALRVGRRDIGPLLPLKTAAPAASESRGSVPEHLTVSMCRSSDYAAGWNACRDAMLARSAAAKGEGQEKPR